MIFILAAVRNRLTERSAAVEVQIVDEEVLVTEVERQLLGEAVADTAEELVSKTGVLRFPDYEGVQHVSLYPG